MKLAVFNPTRHWTVDTDANLPHYSSIKVFRVRFFVMGVASTSLCDFLLVCRDSFSLLPSRNLTLPFPPTFPSSFVRKKYGRKVPPLGHQFGVSHYPYPFSLLHTFPRSFHSQPQCDSECDPTRTIEAHRIQYIDTRTEGR